MYMDSRPTVYMYVGHCLLLGPKPPVCMQKSSRVYELALLCILQLYIEIWPSLINSTLQVS